MGCIASTRSCIRELRSGQEKQRSMSSKVMISGRSSDIIADLIALGRASV